MAWMPVPDKDAPFFTIDAYLALERSEEERHEYLDGCVYAMAGESPDHGRICMNLAVSLGTQLRGTPCEAFAKNTKARLGRPCRVCSPTSIWWWSAVPYSFTTRPGMSCSIPRSLWRCCRPPRKHLTGARSFAAIVPGYRR